MTSYRCVSVIFLPTLYADCCSQFNFYDHSKVILASSGHSITHIDKHYVVTHYTLSGVMARVVSGRYADSTEKKFYEKLLSKLKYSRDVLQSIRRSSTNAEAGGAGGAGAGGDGDRDEL